MNKKIIVFALIFALLGSMLPAASLAVVNTGLCDEDDVYIGDDSSDLAKSQKNEGYYCVLIAGGYTAWRNLENSNHGNFDWDEDGVSDRAEYEAGSNPAIAGTRSNSNTDNTNNENTERIVIPVDQECIKGDNSYVDYGYYCVQDETTGIYMWKWLAGKYYGGYDYDGDRVSNKDEILAGTNPLDAEDTPIIITTSCSTDAYLKIKDFEISSDDLYPLDEVDVEVKTKNTYRDEDGYADLDDVVLVVWLHDITDDESIVEEDIEFDMDRSETITKKLTIQVPADIDETHKYKIYAKVYDSNTEDVTQCAIKSDNVDIRRNKHEIRVEDFEIEPENVICGGTSTLTLDVVNIGRYDEEDVIVTIKSEELGIDIAASTFDLDRGDTEKDLVFALDIPAIAENKEYIIDVLIENEDIKITEQIIVPVSCEPFNGNLDNTILDAPLTVNMAKGEINTIQIALQNMREKPGTYSVEVSNISEWADISIEPKSQVLQPGQKGTYYIYITPTAASEHNFKIYARADGEVVDVHSVTAVIGEPGFKIPGIEEIPMEAIFIGGIVILILLITGVAILARRIS